MLNFGKAARLILAVTAPILAGAQASQVRPAPQPSPGPAPATQPRTLATPSSQQFVTSEAFFRAHPKPSPSSTVPTGTQGLASRPATAGSALTTQPRPTMPQGAQPAVVAPAPALTGPQAPTVQPVATTPAVLNGAGHDATTAVDYAQGQLTVLSQNASLGAVLKLVAAKTGAVVDLAPELQNEPVFAQLGPSPAREVMTRLLDSPRIDYIIMGAGDDAGSLQRIVVRTRQSFGRVAMATVRPPQPKVPEAEEETKLDENGHLANGLTPAEAKLTQEQLMENWKKTREQMRQAEIEQQRQDRENEKTQPQTEPQPEPQPENTQPDNPPQK